MRIQLSLLSASQRGEIKADSGFEFSVLLIQRNKLGGSSEIIHILGSRCVVGNDEVTNQPAP